MCCEHGSQQGRLLYLLVKSPMSTAVSHVCALSNLPPTASVIAGGGGGGGGGIDLWIQDKMSLFDFTTVYAPIPLE